MITKSLIAGRPGAGHITFIAHIARIFCCMWVFAGLVGGTALDPWHNAPLSLSFRLFMALVASLFGGIYVGLTRFQQWGRMLAALVAIITIMLPFSWYVLWIMFSRRTKGLFKDAELVRGAGISTR